MRINGFVRIGAVIAGGAAAAAIVGACSGNDVKPPKEKHEPDIEPAVNTKDEGGLTVTAQSNRIYDLYNTDGKSGISIASESTRSEGNIVIDARRGLTAIDGFGNADGTVTLKEVKQFVDRFDLYKNEGRIWKSSVNGTDGQIGGSGNSSYELGPLAEAFGEQRVVNGEASPQPLFSKRSTHNDDYLPNIVYAARIYSAYDTNGKGGISLNKETSRTIGDTMFNAATGLEAADNLGDENGVVTGRELLKFVEEFDTKRERNYLPGTKGGADGIIGGVGGEYADLRDAFGEHARIIS